MGVSCQIQKGEGKKNWGQPSPPPNETPPALPKPPPGSARSLTPQPSVEMSNRINAFNACWLYILNIEFLSFWPNFRHPDLRRTLYKWTEHKKQNKQDENKFHMCSTSEGCLRQALVRQSQTNRPFQCHHHQLTNYPWISCDMKFGNWAHVSRASKTHHHPLFFLHVLANFTKKHNTKNVPVSNAVVQPSGPTSPLFRVAKIWGSEAQHNICC